MLGWLLVNADNAGQEDLQIKERELAGGAAELVDETASEIATKDGTEVVIWNLWGALVSFPMSEGISHHLPSG
jgi:hypothetical protein